MQDQPDPPFSPAPRLRELQRALQNYLLGEPVAIGDAADDAIVAAIVDAPPLSIPARLGIYRNAYQVRLIDALDDTYPVVHAVLGDDLFVALGEGFVAAHPSLHRSIRWYGAELAEFLRVNPPFAEQPIFAELAMLEWTLASVFDAADHEPLSRAALAAVDPAGWSELRFQFHPSLRQLALQWNTTAVWQALSNNEPPPEPQCAEHAAPWLLWRQNLQNYFRSMADDEAAALNCALHGATFGEMCEALAEWLAVDAIPLRAASLLGLWTDSGIIVAID